MMESEIDVARLRKVLEHVTAHPREWQQANWAVKGPCGTAYCVAGHAVAMFTNATFEWSENDTPLAFQDPDMVYRASAVRLPNGSIRQIKAVARELLGLTKTQATTLFWKYNDLHDLWHHATMFTRGAIEIPAEISEMETHR